jgi:hypothetical protein
MGVNAQHVARAFAAGRIGFGLALLASPELAAGWVGEAARTPGARVITRALGARDAALGLAALLSGSEARQLRRWLIASSACDAIDFTATLGAPKSTGRSLVLVLAGAATLSGLAAAADSEH